MTPAATATATTTDDLSYEGWANKTSALEIPTGMLIGGESTAASSGDEAPLISPRDGAELGRLPLATEADINRAVIAAKLSFKTWSRYSPRERGLVLLRWADLIEANRQELALLVALEMGKPVSTAYEIELRTTIALFRWYGEASDKLMDESPRGHHNSVALITREPVGVVVAIAPWNFPLTMAALKVAPALLAGNAVILKPASQSPLSALRLAELGLQAGLPPAALQVVTGSGATTGAALAMHHDVATLAFTGSTEVGLQLLRYSSESNGKPVYLELGGKSPHIIFDDAQDLDKAIDMAAWAIAFNSGQMCTAGSRLLVQKSILNEVVAGVVEKLKAWVPGDPLDPATKLGPLSSERHRREVLKEIAAGATSGATLITDPDPVPDRIGSYLQPSVFVDVDPDSRLAQHEIFGPVLAVTAFTDDEEAIAIANNSSFGLAAGVWTSNLNRAHRMSRQLAVGNVWINCYEEGDLTTPFGGRKLSGYGSDKGLHGLEKFTTLKTTWIEL